MTLLELIAVILIVGIVGGVAGTMIAQYGRAYAAARTAAQLADAADSALRRMARDVRLALPNSCRVPAGQSATDPSATKYLELLLTRTGGQYRAGTGGGGNILDTAAADTSFNVLGAIGTGAEAPAAGDVLVVRNTSSANTAVNGNNAYTRNSNCSTSTSASCNTALLTTPLPGNGNEPTLTFDARQFPSGSGDGNRFAILAGQGTVSYECTAGTSGASGTGRLTRISGYNIALAQATPPTGTRAVLAENVSGCLLTCAAGGMSGLVWMRLDLLRDGSSVSLYHAVQVTNAM